MSDQNYDLKSSAVLIWLVDGEEPDVSKFDSSTPQSDYSKNLEPWWELRQAIEYASSVCGSSRPENKKPWIKTGNTILSPNKIGEIYNSMRT